MSEKRRNRDKNSSWERKNVKTGRNPYNGQLRTVAILSRRYDENEKCLHAFCLGSEGVTKRLGETVY